MAAPESERARRRSQVGVKIISLDEMWTYVGTKRNWRWIWTAVVEDASGNRWKRFEVGDRSEGTLMRLLGRLPDAAYYSSDGYGAYGCLSMNKHWVGKGGAVNGNAGLHSVLRGRLNGLIRLTKDYSKPDGMLTLSTCASMAEIGLDLENLRVLRIPAPNCVLTPPKTL